MKTYCIKKFYRHRKAYRYCDNTPRTDEWQREVYLQARDLMRENGFRSVVDVGCGSAYKLVTYLGEYETLGTEVSPTYEWLQEKYPDRRWMRSDFAAQLPGTFDLVICADVIEHVLDPDELLGFIAGIECRYIMLSTPVRDLLYHVWNRGYWGPPGNECHIREWSFAEFRDYISRSFEIVAHSISNRKQATQMIICRKSPA